MEASAFRKFSVGALILTTWSGLLYDPAHRRRNLAPNSIRTCRRAPCAASRRYCAVARVVSGNLVSLTITSRPCCTLRRSGISLGSVDLRYEWGVSTESLNSPRALERGP